MKIVVIGSVAAGTSVAAKARRNSEEVEVVVFDQDKDISYSICGIPYFVGGEVRNVESLTPRNAEWFKKRYNVDVYTEHQVIAIKPELKMIDVENLVTGEMFSESYDELVIATGATPIIPSVFVPVLKCENIFTVRTIEDAKKMNAFIINSEPKNATIIGAGFIGLEMAEQLTRRNIQVTMVQRGQQVMPQLDRDMAYRVQKELEAQGVVVKLATEVTQCLSKNNHVKELLTNHGIVIETNLVILAAGVKPNTNLVNNLPIKTGKSGAISVNRRMETSVAHISAVGDVVESFSLITGEPIYRPLGSTANKMGRIAGDVLTGGTLEHRGILGTGIVRLFDFAVGFTGLTESEAEESGYETAVLYNIKPNNADYLGGKELVIKAIADKITGKVLGAQIIGQQGVDKRVDVFATAITLGAKAEDLFHLDLAYAPPFSTTKDPIHYTGMALDNAVKDTPLMTPQELIERQARGEKLQIIDTRSRKQFEKSRVDNARHIPLADLREKMKELEKNRVTVTYCNKGVTGNAAQNILQNSGFLEVYNLSGGNKNYQSIIEMLEKDQSNEGN